MFIHYTFFSIIYKFISIYKNYTLFLILNYYEAIKSILFQQSLYIQNSFFFFFHISMLTFFIITETLEKFFLGNIAILILFRMLPIPFEYIELFSRNYDFKEG